MAQAQPEPEDKIQEKDMNMKETSSVVPFKFNAQAPEFVPRSQTQVPISGYYYPCFHLVGGSGGGSDWLYVGDQDPAHLISNPNVVLPNRSNSKTIHTNDLHQKIIKQVIGFDHDLGFFFFFFVWSS
jgi:La-related protein 7